MLELLLVFACLNPSNDSCGKTTEAYGKQSGLEKMIQEYGEKHPTSAFIVGSAGLYREKRLYYQIYGNFYQNIQADTNGLAQTLWFKYDY